ncbi:hypothetical protein JVT61DRAFT_3902 [Boletus reticuloceps]|uniref:Uncharacterized protein n=1 Tax=Boletus reticuloceps TaxID=495285 RepID=A0A8I3A959_9AGAM|nr:hypothetical protein JVT61DRAFT_3902 [Boletus reticuloceps]
MLTRARRSLRGGINGNVNGAASTPPSDSAAELEDAQAQFESYEAEMKVDAEKLCHSESFPRRVQSPLMRPNPPCSSI